VTALESRLAEFVDRTAQMARFCEILSTRDKPIIFVSGEPGSGKTSLLARMIHECSLRNITRAKVEWSETKNPDHLAVMRSLRDDLGAPHFSSFTSLVNAYYDDRVRLDLNLNASGAITVGSGMQIQGAAAVGDVAGVVVRDCMFVVPRRDLGVSENERMLRLTGRFVEDLAALTQASPVVMFFDTVEKMTAETQQWMWGELLCAVRDDRIPNIICILCGHKMPELDRETRRVIEDTKLGPLGLDDIVEYITKRGIACQAPREMASFILGVTNGHPLEVANKVDILQGCVR
jgi:hypothetical protein